MRHYWKIRSACEKMHPDLGALFGGKPRYYWSHEEAQRRCDDINAAYYSVNDLSLAGTFSVMERHEIDGRFDDADAKDQLS